MPSPVPITIPPNDHRFHALSELAREGVEEAFSDLWHEYGIDLFPQIGQSGLSQISSGGPPWQPWSHETKCSAIGAIGLFGAPPVEA